MNRDSNAKRKLALRRQTLRTLVLSDDQLRLVGGGSTPNGLTSFNPDHNLSGRSATGSANCRL